LTSWKASHDGHLQGREKVMFFHVLTWGNRWRFPEVSAAIQKEDADG
jgi:hypothetical protein